MYRFDDKRLAVATRPSLFAFLSSISLLMLMGWVGPVHAQQAKCTQSALSKTLTYNGSQQVDGLRLAFAGPESIGSVYANPQGLLGKPAVTTAPDGTARFRFEGSSLVGGQRIQMAFCFDGSDAAPVPVGSDDAFTWTIGGEAEVDGEQSEKTPASAPVGVHWDSVDRGNGVWTLQAELGNMGFEDAELKTLEWARLGSAPALNELSWDSSFPWQSLLANPLRLTGRTDGEPVHAKITLPGQWTTKSSDVILLRYAAAPKEHRNEVVQTVVQLTVGSFLQPRFLRQRALEEASNSTGTPADALQLAGESRASFPLTDIEAFIYKVSDNQGNISSMALDADGQKVDLGRLERDEQVRYEATYGRLDPSLAEALAEAGPSDRLSVMAWARLADNVTAGAPARPDTSQRLKSEDIDALYTHLDAYWNNAYADAVAPLVSFLEQRRVENIGVSTSAPIVQVDLSPSQIQALASLDAVDRLYLGGTYEDFLAVAGDTVHADVVHGQGFRGQGTRLAQVEISGGVPASNPFLQTYNTGTGCFGGSTIVQDPNACVGSHATAVAGMIASTHGTDTGMAPLSCLYAAGSCSNSFSQLQAATDRARNWGARAINLSWGAYGGSAPGAMDRYYDNVVINHWRTVVVAAGNGDSPCAPGTGITGSPARAYSVISVGNFDDKNTTLWGDDTMGQCSSYVDPSSQHGDREKPDLSAPGTHFNSTLTASPWNGSVGSGTSFAAPVVTGAAGLLFQSHPSLAVWPEATKPVLMVSATHNIEGSSRLSERDGAGGVVLDDALEVGGNFASNQWGGRSYSCSTASTIDVETITLQQYRRARVALNWTTPGSYAQYATRPSADLDLQIVDPSGNVVAGSYSWDNTFEIVEFTPNITGNYRIRVRQYRCDDSPRYIGWAWKSGSYQVPGLGWEAEGAGMDIYDINQNGTPDLLMMVYDAPSGPNNFRYKIGWDLDASGGATGGWTSVYSPPGVGWLGQGADGQLRNLDSNPRPELVLMAYDAPGGANNFRYLVGWNMNSSGAVTHWSWYPQLTGLGWEGQGAGIETLQIGGSSRPDLLYMTYDNPAGGNSFRYRFGLDLNTSGQLTGGTISCPQVAGVGWEAQGAGAAIGNIGGGGAPDLLFMAYDNPAGANTFRYRIGTDLTSACGASWGSTVLVNGLGWEADGAEPELYDIDGDGDLELFLMAYDDPWGPNTFRYRVVDP